MTTPEPRASAAPVHSTVRIQQPFRLGLIATLGVGVGLLIIGVLNNGLTLLNVSSFYQQVASGALLIAAVSFDQLRLRLART